ncbi:hypothetical protein F0L74_05545 [Chitinophaga agrisoli]|uniref:Uncharacterized protein n=1 Tax=Chitinophaga agrisoli TaxID=2607653 RepID=A0A5B2W234_9BACT|nr:hypothetical protein [Chitinophaga agrisoli]KAA2245425.1 hypothetical protein F0L74_05545 [Chitinophaga agrisoli]
MATQTGAFKFIGRLDGVIGYRRNGKHCLRTMPATVRQTTATKQAAHRFGIASRQGKLIRRALAPHLDLRNDGSTTNRLNKVLVQAGPRQLQALQGFRFNQHTSTDRLFYHRPTVIPDGTLSIPAQPLCPMGAGTHMEVCLITARINFSERRVVDVQESAEIIDLSQPFNGLKLSAPVAGKGALLMILQIRACIMHNGQILPLGNRKYMAADIVAVVPPMEQQQSRKKQTANHPHNRPAGNTNTHHIHNPNNNHPQPVLPYHPGITAIIDDEQPPAYMQRRE